MNEQIEEILLRFTKGKVEKATKKMAECEILRKVYNEMVSLGYAKQMGVVKNLAFYYFMLHPDASEMDLINHLMSEYNGTPRA